MKKLTAITCIFLCVVVGLFIWHRKRLQLSVLNPAIIARSQFSDGDPTRLQFVMDKARRGEPVTIGFIGGSIARGQAATTPERSFPSLVTQWWKDHFPKSNVTVVNAGVNGTGSPWGVLRLKRDLLSHHPDFVVVELSVNDHGDLAHAETFEGIIRQLLSDPHPPAILLLFLMHHDGTNAQDFQSEIGKRYNLPMVSYHDALWPEIASGKMKWSDITDGPIHPNDRGHAAAAVFINSLLQTTLDHLPTRDVALNSTTLPAPRYTDLFDKTEIIEADKLHPFTNRGWTFDEANHCWTSNMPGSEIEFECTGRLIDLLYARVTRSAATVEVTVDDEPAKIFDGWFESSWEGYTQVDEIGRFDEEAPHRVKIRLIATRNPSSTGYQFRIMGLGIAK